MLSFPDQANGALKIAVLAGGHSAERSISLESGQTVSRALRARGHAATCIDPASIDLAVFRWDVFDAAFIALHGRFGEDGTIQTILEQAGVPFTGSGSMASRLAFSKSASKERFLQNGVPTPPYVLIHEADDAGRIQKQANALGFPLVVKPDAQGSSLGVSVVNSPDELPQALTRCFHYDTFGLIEPYVAGTEWTVALFDEQVLPLIQIETSRDFYSYDAKYSDEATGYIFEFTLPSSVVKEIESSGRRASETLGTRGVARVDLRVDRYRRPWVLEVNTVPGFTDHSLVPKAAAKAGMQLGELCERAIHASLAAAATQQQHSV